MQKRNNNGTYGANAYRVGTWMLIVVFMLSVFGASYLFGIDASKDAADHVVGWVVDRVHPATVARNAGQILPTAQADETPSVSVEELENRLDAIVWGGESEKKVMAEGEIFPTFDPSKAMYAQCIKIGGTQPKDCLSYGPRQEKIGTIEVYWPKLHSGETVSDKRAREIAEDNDMSRRFFLDCAEYAKGCADNWTTFTAHKPEGQIYLDLIRQAKGITL